MKKTFFFSFLLAIVLIVACSKVPLTGRRQFSLIPESTLGQMSTSEYKDFLSKNKVVSDGQDAQTVKTVGNDIARAVETYLRQNKAADRVSDFKWEFNLIESKDVNAWCMPGGKVAVYTGIMPVAKDATGLAVVMGHEIAHAVAQHGNERMTQGLLQQVGAMGLDLALQNKSAQTKELFSTAFGMGTQIGLTLPFSRKQETEADKLGLIFMAMAGYNPQEAISFWERMSKAGGAQPPQILSTHPSNATRIADLKKFMPQALKYYKGGSKNKGGTSVGGGKGSTTTPSDNNKGGGAVKPKTGTVKPKTGGTSTTPDTNNNKSGGTVKPKTGTVKPKNPPKY